MHSVRASRCEQSAAASLLIVCRLRLLQPASVPLKLYSRAQLVNQMGLRSAAHLTLALQTKGDRHRFRVSDVPAWVPHLLPLQQDVLLVAVAVVAGTKLLPAQHPPTTRSSCAVLALQSAPPTLQMNTCHEEAQAYDHRSSHRTARVRLLLSPEGRPSQGNGLLFTGDKF